MKWSEVSVHTTHEATEAVANILHEAGASGVVIEDSEEPGKERVDQYGEIYALDKDDFPSEGVIIKAYLPVNSFINETVENLELEIEGLRQFSLNPGRFTIGITEVDEEDWANSWKQYFHPVKISKRFTIVPTWEEYTPVESDELIIELDPGMAFGTGTHPTTVLCLQALEKYLEPGQTIVDVGTGSGVLAIGAALLGAKHITALDLDEVAVRAAQENVTYNHADDRITVLKGNLLDSIEEPPDMIIANILAEVIMSFSKDAYQLVKPGGLFITSGIIGAKRDEVRNDLTAQGFEIVETVLMEDWVAIIARKGSE
ncbi:MULTISPECIES: 50S ribosomal protein L11 methyltransferase [unclassified Sporosarcina]|uniref:50S ribosomal protein L11 methyltransferase n=1 Tax=unclassified Sporosarcina TaxID=2647733 RepID=UPI000C166F4C|nr:MULTISPECIES: 50S ribosomal protein L11 methyltransferase [unclassified Sporosarcina]PID05757.1 50S ribosomal protein L11 methyltransferase [Sporosarcina sp. P30]PID08951.1 50S ribosomal protein L11 methyltransferase [Sporosarcina sp. P31]PID12037.1 50S ribosomal protein L11 methyltransferase [Sporosarcina sp. P32b]